MHNHRFFWGKILSYETDLHAEYPEVTDRLERLLLKLTPQHVKLHGLPGTGKSSAAHTLKSRSRFVYLDMNLLYAKGDTGFYEAFADELETVLGIDSDPDMPPQRRIKVALDRSGLPGEPVLVVLDHFDRFLQLGDPVVRQGVLGTLFAHMTNQRTRHVGFLFISVRPLSQICRIVDHMSDLAGRCTDVQAWGPSEPSLTSMLQAELTSAGMPPDPTVLKEVLKVTGRNPSLVQMAGSMMADVARTAADVAMLLKDQSADLFRRIFDLFPESDWKALLRWQADRGAANPDDTMTAQRMADALVISTDREYFCPVFEQYLHGRLNERAGADSQGPHVTAPMRLPIRQHEKFLKGACNAQAYQVNWKLIGAGPEDRHVYYVEPISASGDAMRPLFLKIDKAPSIDKEYRDTVRVREEFAVATPPVEKVVVSDQKALAGLKTDIAASNPRIRYGTLRDWIVSDQWTVEELTLALRETFRTLASMYRNAVPKERRLGHTYRVYPEIQTTLEAAFASLSDPFGANLLRRLMLPPKETVDRIRAFLDQRETQLIGPSHGDLHGRNVIRDDNGNIQVIDFGRYQSEGHIVADVSRLELSLVFDYAHARVGNLSDSLRVLRALVNRSAPGSVFEEDLEGADGRLDEIMKACRMAVRAELPTVDAREYLVSLLGTLSVLLSFKQYFDDTYRWVAALYAHYLLDVVAG